MLIAALFTVAKIRKQPKCPFMGEWIKKLWSIYTMECYPVIKKERNPVFVTTGMGLDVITLSDKERQILCDFICGI